MNSVSFSDRIGEALVLGAHCDDVEIGCGGTLVALARRHPDLHIRIVLFSGDAVRSAEARAAIGRLLPGAQCDLEIHEFRDGFLPSVWAQVKERFEELKRRSNPDVVFTHYARDAHQDHRTICELAWNTFRNHLVLEYEIPKYDGDFGRPNFYAPLSPDIVQHKIDTLLESYSSQRGKQWFTADLFSSLMRVRGMECNSPSGFAEAFYARKLVAQW